MDGTKLFELRRDHDKGEQRLQVTYKSLIKHDLDEKKPGAWGWIPKSVFDIDLSSRAYGLLVILAMEAGPIPAADNCRVIERVSETTILRWLGIKNSNQRGLIHDLLEELEEAEVITIDGDRIKLEFSPIQSVEGGFCKIYTSTYQAILDQSHGIVTLNRLAVYLGIRSMIFEGEKGGPNDNVVYMGRGNGWIAELVDLPVATVRNIIQWLIEHKIMAWNLVVNRNKHHNKHYYLAELFQAERLVSWICAELKGGSLLRVVA
ncbi:hypothetical protein PS411_07915 [Limosilactobacillus reuteri]|uniref:hypothetical protein n=1 Tax=Limosilactobacillus reuteri TaxID=1598 RepID=UPI002F26CC56